MPMSRFLLLSSCGISALLLSGLPGPSGMDGGLGGAAFAQDDDDDDDDDRPRRPGGRDDDDDDDGGAPPPGGGSGADDDDNDDDGPAPRPPSGGNGQDDDDDDDRPSRPAPPRDNGGDDDDDDDDDRPPRPVAQDNDDDARAPVASDDAAPVRPRPASQQRDPAPAPAPAPVPRAIFSPEIVVDNLSPEDLAILLDEGFTVLSETPLPGTVRVLTRLSGPQGLTLEGARDRVRALPSGPEADLNHFYRSRQDEVTTASAPPVSETLDAADDTDAVLPTSSPTPSPDIAIDLSRLPSGPCTHANCAIFDAVAWPRDRAALPDCRVTLPVGILDTGVNVDHEFLAGASVDLITLADTTVDPSRAVHGTAVTSLLVAPPGGRVEGLIPEATVIVADIFGRDGDDERADVVALLRGLDLMAERGVRVLNLSLSGPPNTVLQEAIDRLARENQMVIVAAVGNEGPSAEPAYPAAYSDVIAVTAVDRRGRVFDGAQRGDHVDIAAPGVELLLATSVSGARPQTGTSFAVPFVTAAAAVILSREPQLTPPEVAERISALTQDFGAEGRDEIFGHGLLLANALCP